MPDPLREVRVVVARRRGNDYGALLLPTWPHVSLGVSAHLGGRLSHVTLHLPFGAFILGCVGVTHA